MAASLRVRALAMVTLAIRVITLGLLAASLAVIAATPRTHYDLLSRFLDDDDSHVFQNLYTYRYVLSVAAIGCAYTLMLAPVAAIAVIQGRRIGGTGAARFLIFMDIVFCALYVSGGAAGLGFVVDNQRIYGKFFDSATKKFYTFFDASCGLLLAAAFCTVGMIMISVYSK